MPLDNELDAPLTSVAKISSPAAIEGLLSLVRAADPILDTTYGNGTFWKGSTRKVHGCDVDPERAKDQAASFLALPFADGGFPTVVYDPPFHPGITSAEIGRYRSLGKNNKELKTLFQAGLRECWRVTSRHLIVKCQGFINGRKPQWMPLWAIEVCGEPYEWLVVHRTNKRISSRWKSTLSLHRNHADYLVFDKRGNYHL